MHASLPLEHRPQFRFRLLTWHNESDLEPDFETFWLSCHVRQGFSYTSCSSGTFLCSVLWRLSAERCLAEPAVHCSSSELNPVRAQCAAVRSVDSATSCLCRTSVCLTRIWFCFAWDFGFSGLGFFVVLFCLFCLFCFLRQDLWMPRNSLYRSGWPQTDLNHPLPPDC